MPVGNDVVDLEDPDNRPTAIHPRFDRRVFTDAELARLNDASDEDARHRLRWSLWAAKESALKYLRQIDARISWHPREFAVRVETTAVARVRHGDRELAVTLDVTSRRVHAVTPAGADDALTALHRVESGAPPDAEEASTGVRRLAARATGRLLGIADEEITITGPGGRAAPRGADIPRALRGGERLAVDVSLSHDGRWLACAVRRRPDAG
ncbi:MAG TPA: 4-phosphopantetheinyl transferase family protein [Alphaproteobacteria bacterium]|nr:4-phosphopantetheinyl transferase family protein [Alphaproteobacteria bacterium]